MFEPEPLLLDPPRPTHVRFLVLGLIASAAASAYLTRHCMAAANTTIAAELHVNMGDVIAAFGWGYLVGQVPGGWLGQRYGTRAAFAASSVVWSLLTVWTAFSGSLGSLVASRFAFGVAQAGLAPLSGLVIKDWIPERRRGVCSAFVSAAMSLGGVAALWLSGLMLERKWLDWRSIFLLWSVVGIVWAAAFYALFRTRPEQHPRVNAAELALIRGRDVAPSSEENKGGWGRSEAEPPAERAGSSQDLDASPVPPVGRGVPLNMLCSLALWMLCIQSFFRAAGYGFYSNWFFPYLEYAWKTPKDEAGRLSTLPLFATVAGALLGGVLVDRVFRATGSRWLSRSGIAAASLAVCAGLTWASAHATSATQLAAILALGAFSAGMASPAIWAATIDIGGAQTAVTVGIMNMAGCLADALLPPVVDGMIKTIQKTGGEWNQVILLHVAIYAAGAVACVFMRPDKPVA